MEYDIFEDVIISNDKISSQTDNGLNTTFVQYIHISRCVTSPCQKCVDNHLRIFLNDSAKPKVGNQNHPNCDCMYIPVEEIEIGSISKIGLNAPDIWLRAYGRLPDYYITKNEAETVYGWNSRRNTLAGKAPGKMIGGDVYNNVDKLLPVAEGRVWYECDIDYESGGRGNKRLFYSNDGLMFYSPDHGKRIFYYIK